MSGDSRQEVPVAAAIERLSELVPEVDSNIERIHEILNEFESGEYEASLIRLETFDADFCAGHLYDDLALARGYFKQLGLGPDAKVMLKEAEKLRENLRDYGVCLVHISDLESGRLGNHTNAAQTISEAREKEMLLRLNSMEVELSFNEIRAKFEKIRDSATGNVGAQSPKNAEPPALTKKAEAVQADTADANSQPAGGEGKPPNTFNPADRETKLKSLQPAEQKAYFSFVYAEQEAGKTLADRDAYDWLKENGLPHDGGDLGELTDYTLPAFDTWSRQVRAGRNAVDGQKYNCRADRPTGGSIVKADKL